MQKICKKILSIGAKLFVSSLFACLGLLVLVLESHAATYYVDQVGGNDANDGLSQAGAWKTISKVNSRNQTAGDLVLFKRNNIWNEKLSPDAGVSGNPVTYGAYGTGDRPIIKACQLWGSDNHVLINDLELYNNSDGDDPLSITEGCNYVTVNNCKIHVGIHGTAYAAVQIGYESHYVTIINSEIYHERTDMQNDALTIRSGSSYGRYEGNIFGAATHYSVNFEGNSDDYPYRTCSYNIFRNNEIDNPEGAMFALQSGSNWNLIEGNAIIGGKATPYCVNLPRTFKLLGENNIVRNNVLQDNIDAIGGSGLSSESYGYTDGDGHKWPVNTAIRNKIYNNLITGIARHPLVIATNGDEGAYITNNYYKNNIIAGNIPINQLHIQDHPNIYGNYFIANLFYRAGQVSILNVSGTSYSVAAIESIDPLHFLRNLQTDPMLDSLLMPESGSPCIDSGTALTTITSSTGSGNSFTVRDASYFTDGWAIGSSGDVIRLHGSSIVVRINDINYITNTIIVENPVSWENGQGVSLDFSGNSPDIGAYEHASSGDITPPSAPQGLSVE